MGQDILYEGHGHVRLITIDRAVKMNSMDFDASNEITERFREFDADDDFKAFWGVLSHCTRPFNAFGLPALSMPAGFDYNKMPVGFQLVGRPFDENLLFRVGRAYERETPWANMASQLN